MPSKKIDSKKFEQAKKPTTDKPQIISAGYFIIRPAEGVASKFQFLLMKHIDRWDLPKGHVDPGETIEQAAVRELSEETSIQPEMIWTDPKFRFTQTYRVQMRKGSSKLKELVIFLAYLQKPCDIVLTEHIGFEWFDWPSAASIQPRIIDPLLAQFAEHLQLNPAWPPSP